MFNNLFSIRKILYFLSLIITKFETRKFLATNNIDERLSIGENCNSSWYLKVVCKKTNSYPFDWIFSSPQIIKHCIETNFEFFLDKSLITSFGKKAGHKEYHASLFNHRDPLASEKDYSYYKRTIERFKKLLKSKKSLLFVCTVINEPHKRLGWSKGFNNQFPLVYNQSIKDFEPLIHSITKFNKQTKFIFIEQFTEIENPTITVTKKNDKYIWIQHNALGKNDGSKFLNKIDDYITKSLYKSF